jgi:hypothetical protein
MVGFLKKGIRICRSSIAANGKIDEPSGGRRKWSRLLRM